MVSDVVPKSQDIVLAHMIGDTRLHSYVASELGRHFPPHPDRDHFGIPETGSALVDFPSTHELTSVLDSPLSPSHLPHEVETD